VGDDPLVGEVLDQWWHDRPNTTIVSSNPKRNVFSEIQQSHHRAFFNFTMRIRKENGS
jgi:hypothetical protein